MGRRKYFSGPPKFWEYEGELFEDVGGYLKNDDDTRHLPIIKVWEEGIPIGNDRKEAEEELKLIIQEIIERNVKSILKGLKVRDMGFATQEQRDDFRRQLIEGIKTGKLWGE